MGHEAFFAMSDAAARRMAAPETSRVARAAPSGSGFAPVSNISLTKPARPVDPLLAAQSARGPIKGGRIDFIA